jgi:pimeloyl-ACP methyl ester carboxylesterase
MGGHNVLVYASQHPDKLRAIVAIDSPADYPARAVDFLRSISERPGKRFKSLEEAIANFKMLPRETLARPEILRHAASHTFRQTPEGDWMHKLDRRTTVREPINLGSDLAKITCPALYVKVEKSPFPTIEQSKAIVAMMPLGKLAVLPNSYHHAMFDNPVGLNAILQEFLRDIN